MNIFEEETPKAIAQRLRNLCETEGVTQHKDLVLDLYVLCQSATPTQIPDEKLLEGLVSSDPSYWQERVEVTKRKEFLERLAKSTYVAQARALNDPMKAVLILIDAMKKAQLANDALKGKSLINFHIGKFMGSLDEEEGEEMLDEIGSSSPGGTGPDADEFMEAISSLTDIFDNQTASAFFAGCGMGSSCHFGTAPGAVLAKEVIEHSLKLGPSILAFYKLFTAECNIVGSGNVQLANTPDVTKDRHRDKMEDYSQISTADPLDVAREGFTQRLAEKKLDVEHHQKEEAGKCHVFVLLDVTGSMMSDDIGTVNLCRAFVANVITLSLLNLAMGSGWIVHVVPFTGQPCRHMITHATDKDSALAAAKALGTYGYTGGDTNIERAVLYAYKELQNDPQYKKCDIVLLTDGFSPMSNRVSSEKPPRTKLRTLLLAGSRYGGHTKRLQDASDSFEIIGWDDKKQVLDTGSALNGINKRDSNG